MAKATKNTTQEEEKKRTSFILRTSIIRKLNYIKVQEGGEITDFVDVSLSRFISDWEKKNGEIKLK